MKKIYEVVQIVIIVNLFVLGFIFLFLADCEEYILVFSQNQDALIAEPNPNGRLSLIKQYYM
jgi:hypothetical protein